MHAACAACRTIELAGAQAHHLAVLHRARLAVGDVVDRDQCRDLAAERCGARCHGKELVERAALVRLEMRKADVSETLDRHHAADCFAHQRKQFARPGMKQQRFIVINQVLVETEPGG